MKCNNCGAGNPAGSLYCQDCGHRLGDWVPQERANKLPTPPTGLSRAAAPPPPGPAPCPRCGTANAPHLRFCNTCGFQLGSGAAPHAPQAAAPRVAPPAPVCWRCHSIGDTGAEFCKFCGARYSDGQRAAPAAPVSSVGGAVAAFAHAAPAPLPAAQPGRNGGPGFGQPTSNEGAGPRHDARPAVALLVAILKDGTDGRAYPIHDEQTDVGRTEGAVQLADDPYLSARHARLLVRPEGILVRDLDSANGVYVRLREPVELLDGDFVLLGQQVLHFQLLPETELPLGPAMHRGALVFGTPEVARIARFVQYTTEGIGRDVHHLYRDETVIGREQGDIVCTDDPFMSRRHAAVSIDRAMKRFVLRDLGSSNGTALRIRGERILRPGDQFRVGRHLFRYDRPDGGAQGRAVS